MVTHNNLSYARKISASALSANRSWMNTIANNVANALSVDTGKKTKDGNFVPYARQVPVFEKVLSESFRKQKVNGDIKDGVAVKGIVSLDEEIRKVYDPSHPAARKPGSFEAGYVYYPKISIPQEMADMRIASAAYEANLSVLSVTKKMSEQAFQIGRR